LSGLFDSLNPMVEVAVAVALAAQGGVPQ
jgi:hypothetical protein